MAKNDKLQNEERVTIVEKTSYALPQQAVNSLFDEGGVPRSISVDLIMMPAYLQ